MKVVKELQSPVQYSRNIHVQMYILHVRLDIVWVLSTSVFTSVRSMFVRPVSYLQNSWGIKAIL